MTNSSPAEWRTQRLRAKLDPNTIKVLKDQLLRVSFQMEQYAVREESETSAE